MTDCAFIDMGHDGNDDCQVIQDPGMTLEFQQSCLSTHKSLEKTEDARSATE